MRHRRSSGSLKKRGSVWYCRFRNDGKDIMVSTGTGDRAEALQVLARESAAYTAMDERDRLAVVKRRLDDASRRASRTPIGEVWGLYESSARRPDSSRDMMDTYKGYVERLARVTGVRTMEDVTQEVADRFATDLYATRSANTHNKYMNGLALVWRVVGEPLGISNPWVGITRRKLDTHTRRPLTDTELERVLEQSGGEMKRLIAISAFTGLRMGDASRLSWLDIRGDTIQVVTHKTGVKVRIPLHPRLGEILGRRMAHGFVCPTLARLDSDVIGHRMEHIFRRAGIVTKVKTADGKQSRPDCTFHSLRHYFVSKSISAGIPPVVVQALVGHSTYAMTQHYTHIDEETFMRAFGSMSHH